MEDEKIIDLYFKRDESAIAYTDEKYGAYCQSVARAILCGEDAAEECKNDTYFKAWNAIPPTRPLFFKAFLAKITRHLALDRYDRENAAKRCSLASVVWDEISDSIPAAEGDPSENLAIKEAVNGFLSELNSRDRVVFLQRYFYFLPLSVIGKRNGMKTGAVKVSLCRLRQRFKLYLEEKEIVL